MAKAPKAKAKFVPQYILTAVAVRQNVAGRLDKPDDFDTMTRAEKTAWFLGAIENYQNLRQNMGHESTVVWGDQIQFNAAYVGDAIAALQAAGFYTRSTNNNLDGYDELEISARPFPVVPL